MIDLLIMGLLQSVAAEPGAQEAPPQAVESASADDVIVQGETLPEGAVLLRHCRRIGTQGWRLGGHRTCIQTREEAQKTEEVQADARERFARAWGWH